MFNRVLAAASAAAFGLALAAPAAALTLVFDVEVGMADGVPGFTPVSFRQTWTFEPGTASGFNVFGLTGQTLQGTASATAPPLAPNLALDLIGFPGVLSASGGYDFRSGAFIFPSPFGGAPFIGPTVTTLDANQERRADVDVLGLHATHYDRTTLRLGSNTPYPVDEASLLAFIASAPFVGWTETEGLRVAGFDRVDKTYTGIARLAPAVVGPGGPPVPPVTGVPEPAGWALMIVGFGGVGALARRRRGALA